MFNDLPASFEAAVPSGVDFCSLRVVSETHELLSVRQNIPEPLQRQVDRGAMATVVKGGGMGYGATCDLSPGGIQRACAEALKWAEVTARCSVIDFSKCPFPRPRGEYRGPEGLPWSSVSLEEKLDLLRSLCEKLKIHSDIVDWQASLWHVRSETLYLTAGGGTLLQSFSFVIPGLSATANRGTDTQTRSFGGLRENCRQGGMEILRQLHFSDQPRRIAEEALQLLTAPNCPEGTMDLVLAADQMVLQIHESIGHPLELDRILGDERNYAGTSFVTLDMIGSYRYGSDLLNVTFDPTDPSQVATYRHDDEGLEARKVFLIERGILKRALGGLISQVRTSQAGTANARACSWNRPPIDRMANVNLECGTQSLGELIASVQRGVFMQTNRSWSIDDSRNKFQFGCEWGQLIENGELTQVVKNPNYRGISATFWRSLAGVGNAGTFRVMGTPFCGKGEPNQCIRVGHASPACLFRNVEVFGGV